MLWHFRISKDLKSQTRPSSSSSLQKAVSLSFRSKTSKRTAKTPCLTSSACVFMVKSEFWLHIQRVNKLPACKHKTNPPYERPPWSLGARVCQRVSWGRWQISMHSEGRLETLMLVEGGEGGMFQDITYITSLGEHKPHLGALEQTYHCNTSQSGLSF